MSKKVTSVSIVEKRIPQELQELIHELVRKSLEYGLDFNEIVTELNVVNDLYQQNKTDLENEDRLVKSFRRKVEKFFGRNDLLPIGNLAFNEYRFEYANYHIEAICSAFKLFRSDLPLTISGIYANAKNRMATTDYYVNIRKRAGRNCNIWHLTSKKENIQGLKNYFEWLTDDFLKKDIDLNSKCKLYLSQYAYSPNEEVWIKMIFLISNS